jgi:hypothetical protein
MVIRNGDGVRHNRLPGVQADNSYRIEIYFVGELA